MVRFVLESARNRVPIKLTASTVATWDLFIWPGAGRQPLICCCLTPLIMRTLSLNTSRRNHMVLLSQHTQKIISVATPEDVGLMVRRIEKWRTLEPVLPHYRNLRLSQPDMEGSHKECMGPS